VNVEPAGAPPASLAAGFLEPNGSELGVSRLLTVFMTVTPSPNPRLLTVEHVSLPPLMEDDLGVPSPVHYTMILRADYVAMAPESTVCAIWNTGDVNLDLSLAASDVIAIVNCVLKGGVDPYPCPAAADVNCSGHVTSSDVIFLVNHVFKGGFPPCDVCTLIPDMWSCPFDVER
jgi:hypothetical protein